MHALFRVLRLALRLCCEGCDEQRVGRSWHDDIAVVLDVSLRRFEIPEWDLCEAFEGRCHLGKVVEVFGVRDRFGGGL